MRQKGEMKGGGINKTIKAEPIPDPSRPRALKLLRWRKGRATHTQPTLNQSSLHEILVLKVERPPNAQQPALFEEIKKAINNLRY